MKSLQVSRTLLCILADFYNAVVWMISVLPLMPRYHSPLFRRLWTILRKPIKIVTIITFMFLRFFSSLARSRYLSIFLLSFIFILLSAGTAKSNRLQFFSLILGLVFGSELRDSFVFQSFRAFLVLYSFCESLLVFTYKMINCFISVSP